MAITQITLNLGGDDKDLKVDYVSELIQETFDMAAKSDSTPTLTFGDGNGTRTYVLHLDPSSYRVQRLGKETS